MIAVVAPGLGDIFQFHVSGQIETYSFSLLQYVFSKKVLPDHRYIPLLQSKISLEGNLAEFPVGPDGDGVHLGFMIQDDLWNRKSDALIFAPLGPGKYFPLLDNVVGQEIAGYPAYLLLRNLAPDFIKL